MRIIFIASFVLLSLIFTIKGFDYPYKNFSGQIGAGFLPRWVGILLIISTVYTLYKDIKEKEPEQKDMDLKSVVVLLSLTIGFLVLFSWLGALLSMFIFMLAVLFIYNRERYVLNITYSIITSASIYLLLNKWLNAGLPKGLFTFF